MADKPSGQVMHGSELLQRPLVFAGVRGEVVMLTLLGKMLEMELEWGNSDLAITLART